MSIAVPLYGFGGSSGGARGTLTVTAPAGVTVTVSGGGKTKTKIADADGAAVFKGLANGDWTVTITNGVQTATKTVAITADYAVTMTFFEASIKITYPSGSICTVTNGVTTLTAPDTSGTWTCVVPNTGTWTVKATNGTQSKSANVSITKDGQSSSITLSYTLTVLPNSSVSWTGSGTYEISSGEIDAQGEWTGSANVSKVWSSMVDVTNYKTLTFTVGYVDHIYGTSTGSQTYAYFFVGPSGDSVTAQKYFTAVGSYSIDISSITGQKCFGLVVGSDGTDWAQAIVNSIELTL